MVVALGMLIVTVTGPASLEHSQVGKGLVCDRYARLEFRKLNCDGFEVVSARLAGVCEDKEREQRDERERERFILITST